MGNIRDNKNLLSNIWNKEGGGGTVHFMDELPEYRDIYEKHRVEERKLEEYREQCKDEALDMLKEYFYSLWD